MFRSVHPRACGEHRVSQQTIGVFHGSSPRLRGTLRPRLKAGECIRFIPAPAGNTWKQIGRTCIRDGSSPRLRGTRQIRESQIRADRFIPAPAGNTQRQPLKTRNDPVHPRACGEHVFLASVRKPLGGSSPRLRGTLRGADQDALARRFIPAPAGNTSAPPATTGAGPVHPRACGEHATRYHKPLQPTGSSPRLRGTQLKANLPPHRMRFIPAPAGNTKPRRARR